MLDLLFVYGSLMSEVPSAASRWLRQHSSLIAKDSLPGHLYDLGRYPGLVMEENKPALVYGEIHRLYKPAEALRYLDEYEGTAMANPEYERIVCQTMQQRNCWVYQYLPTDHSLPRIQGGDYYTFYPTNSRHLTFISRKDASTAN